MVAIGVVYVHTKSDRLGFRARVSRVGLRVSVRVRNRTVHPSVTPRRK